MSRRHHQVGGQQHPRDQEEHGGRHAKPGRRPTNGSPRFRRRTVAMCVANAPAVSTIPLLRGEARRDAVAVTSFPRSLMSALLRAGRFTPWLARRLSPRHARVGHRSRGYAEPGQHPPLQSDPTAQHAENSQHRVHSSLRSSRRLFAPITRAGCDHAPVIRHAAGVTRERRPCEEPPSWGTTG